MLVTGASGGVGSVAIAILAHLGYEVAALTTSTDEQLHAYLRELGASEIVPAPDADAKPKPLAKGRWAGAVDTVGSKVLAHVLSEMAYGGRVAACGLAAGPDLPATVMPFILRNVSLLGVDSVVCPIEPRQRAWQRLVKDLPEAALEAITDTATLEQVPERAADMMANRTRGRILVDVGASG